MKQYLLIGLLAMTACQAPLPPKVRIVYADAKPTPYAAPDFATFEVKGQLSLPAGVQPENVQIELENGSQKSKPNANGEFRFQNVPVGSDQHLRAFSVLSDGSHFEARVPLRPQTSQLDLGTLLLQETGSVTGVVKDSGAGVTVFIPGTSFVALTDSEGAFILPNVPSGTYEVRALKGTSLSEPQQADIKAGQVTTLALDALQTVPASAQSSETQSQVSGHVLTDTQTPLPGALIHLLGSAQTTLSGQDGRFEIEATSLPESVVLRVFHPNTGVKEFSFSSEIIIKPLTLTLPIVNANTQTKSQIQGQLPEYPQATVDTLPETTPVQTNDQGEYILDIPPGRYLLRARDDLGKVIASQSVTLEPGQTITPQLDRIQPYGKAAFCQQENTNNINIHAPRANVTVNIDNTNLCQVS